MSSNPVSYVSPEEYLERERESDERHEYLYGEIIAVARPSPPHGVVVNNVAFALRIRLEAKGCQIFTESLRVSVQWGPLIAYPDVVLHCGEPEWVDDKHDTLTNPSFVVEVLSPSTMDYDRGTKSRLYRMLSSMSEYLFINPAPVDIEHWRRLPSGNWEVAIINDSSATLRLESLDCEIPVGEIYKNVERYV
jgi:Uma2 family endonuclease